MEIWLWNYTGSIIKGCISNLHLYSSLYKMIYYVHVVHLHCIGLKIVIWTHIDKLNPHYAISWSISWIVIYLFQNILYKVGFQTAIIPKSHCHNITNDPNIGSLILQCKLWRNIRHSRLHMEHIHHISHISTAFLLARVVYVLQVSNGHINFMNNSAICSYLEEAWWTWLILERNSDGPSHPL